MTGTEVFGRRYKLEELIARMLGDLRKHSEREFGTLFSMPWSADPSALSAQKADEDQDFALTRLRAAFALAGIEHVDFELEPVAAAYAYRASLDHDELILIGDFGGGTSDFSLLRVGPDRQRRKSIARSARQQRPRTRRRRL